MGYVPVSGEEVGAWGVVFLVVGFGYVGFWEIDFEGRGHGGFLLVVR